MKNFKRNKYNSLEGKFLISSPSMDDSIFKKTLIYVISDNESGSMGIIINKPALNINFQSIFGNFKNNINQKKLNKPEVFYGGPVELDKGFIIHTNDYKDNEAITLLDNNLALSSNISIIEDILLGEGPSKSIFTIGYTGWDSYQLKSEISKNTWIEIELDIEIIFSNKHNDKWSYALSKLGINSKRLNNSIFTSYTGSA